MASALVSRFDLASRAGKTFGGNRDIYGALGYKNILTPEDYRFRYERDGVATRIVETFPKSTWRSNGVIVDDQDPENETPLEEAWRQLDKRLQLWPAFGRVDILAGLGEYAVLLIGVRGATGSSLEEPLPDTFALEDVIYTAAFGQEDVEITKLITEPSDERFGQPEIYSLDRVGVPRGTTALQTSLPRASETKVHWSRIIHVADGLLDDKITGKPRLKNVWNRLDDLDKIAGGGSEAFWLRAHQGYVAKLDNDLEWDDGDIKDVQEQVEEFAHQLRRTIGQRGVDFTVLGSDVAEIGGNVDAILRLISASTGIPVRILTGSERGELASSQDKTNFDDRVSDRRTQFAEPVVVRPFVDRLIKHEALPAATDDEYAVRWPEIDALDESEKASVAVKLSTVNKQAGETIITRDEIRTGVLGLPPSAEVDELVEADAEAAARTEAMIDQMAPGEADAAAEDEELIAASRLARVVQIATHGGSKKKG